MSNAKEGTTVTVTSKGQATIPKEFREKLHIDTPGRVRFIENEDGDVVIRPVRRPSEIRGDLATSAIEDEQSATELLREERERDRKELDEGRITAESDE
jgi:AbrB family looped-hinge helix DNA binding protein